MGYNLINLEIQARAASSSRPQARREALFDQSYEWDGALFCNLWLGYI